MLSLVQSSYQALEVGLLVPLNVTDNNEAQRLSAVTNFTQLACGTVRI